MTATSSDHEREKAKLARFRDIAGRLDGDRWGLEAAGGETRVLSRRATGETVTLCTIHADALSFEYDLISSAFDLLVFFLALQDRAAAKVRALSGQIEAKAKAERGKDFAAQAAMLCAAPSFRRFLETKGGPVADATAADTRMKGLIDIRSKKQLNDDPRAADRFKALRRDFDFWMKGGGQ